MKSDFRLIHRTVPHAHEDVIGFLTRVAERNHVGGAAAILAYVKGTANTSVETGDIPRIAHYCRNHLEELLQLSGIEQRLSDGSRAWQIAGEWVSKASFISARKVKICPICLQEGMFIRGLWSLSFYAACAQHEVRLVDRCPGCGRRLKWDRRRISHCGCTFNLANAPASPASESLILVAQLFAHRSNLDIVIRPHAFRNREIERLAELSLDGLCKTIWFLGHCLAKLGQYGTGHGRLKPTGDEAEAIIHHAVEILRTWPTELGARLDVMARRNPSNSSSALLDRLLGPVQHYLHEELQVSELDFLRLAYEQHIRMIWKTFSKTHQLKTTSRQSELEFD